MPEMKIVKKFYMKKEARLFLKGAGWRQWELTHVNTLEDFKIWRTMEILKGSKNEVRNHFQNI